VAAGHLPLAQTLELNRVVLVALEHHHPLLGPQSLTLVAAVAEATVQHLEILRVRADQVVAAREASVQQQGQMRPQILAAVAAAAETGPAMAALAALA
jgi:hypothetical protein